MPWQRKDDAPYVVVTDAGYWSAALVRWPWLQFLAPGLAGEVLDVTTFCQRGPEWNPPITMSDIVILGFIPPNGRPFTLLAVARAIARQELFAQYCESVGGHWTAPVCLTTDNDGSEPSQSGFIPLAISPAFTTEARVTVTEWQGSVLTDAQLQVGPAEAWPWTYSASLAQYRAGTFTATAAGAAGLHYGVSANMPGSGLITACVEFHVEGETFTPPAPVQDPDVTLPTGDGSTVDQLEVKLDLVQQMLRSAAHAGFGLDMTTTLGPVAEISGQLDDAVGLLLTIIDRPDTVSEWYGVPPRFPNMAFITFGNSDGWWESWEVLHEDSVYMPLPPGASRFAVVCRPPMRATVTLYRPLLGPN